MNHQPASKKNYPEKTFLELQWEQLHATQIRLRERAEQIRKWKESLK